MESTQTDQLAFASATAPLRGDSAVPGDKSISHRSLMLASQALGVTHIEGLLEGEDVLSTLRAMQALGVDISRQPDGRWKVVGNGLYSLQEPDDVLDLGNAGTGVRLLMGLLAAYPFRTIFTGDASLRHRPMKRVMAPLEDMGAQCVAREGTYLPLSLQGGQTLPVTYRLPVASAQVKSAILLAALHTPGTTTVIEPEPCRDHTERMLRFFGFACDVVANDKQGGNRITLTGEQSQTPQDRIISVPGDPSSAAFPLVAALLVEGSQLTLRNICMNPLRTGLFTSLQEMGADIQILNAREEGGEPVADLEVCASALTGTTIPAERAPSMIDEYPVLAVAAAFAHGETRMCGLHELRVKESNRLDTMAESLQACGVDAVVEGDDLVVRGNGGANIAGGALIDSKLDHRIAMSFLVAGLRSNAPITVQGIATIATSFPDFQPLMQSLGVKSATSANEAGKAASRAMVIAVDGPAASGKGTLARRLASELGMIYLDTGSLYRAVGMKLVYNGQLPEDSQAAIAAAQTIQLQDLSNPRLRQENVGNAASIVSAIPEVRAALLTFQRDIAASPQGAVLDGRDIGTVICPDADMKFFITADIETRAGRRHRELQGQGIEVVYDSVLADLQERDERDKNRSAAPLKPAEDAVLIDSSHLTANEVFECVLTHVQQHGSRHAVAASHATKKQKSA